MIYYVFIFNLLTLSKTQQIKITFKDRVAIRPGYKGIFRSPTRS
jgi:hypothetical protein